MTITRPDKTTASNLNILLVALVWLACVLGGTEWGWGATLLFFICYQQFFGLSRNTLLCIMTIAGIGFGVDCTLSTMGLINFSEKNTLAFIPLPGWMAALWLSIATLFLHGLQQLRLRPLLSAAFGAMIGPAIYYINARLQGMQPGMILRSFLLCYSILWAVMTPLFCSIAASIDNKNVDTTK